MTRRFVHGLVVAAGLVCACGHAEDAGDEEGEAPARVHVTCAPAETARIADTRTLRGTVSAAPERDAVVAPQVAGRLLRVSVQAGDTVDEGDVIAEVESQVARDDLARATAELQQAQAAARNAHQSLERSRHLFERGIAARQEVEDAEAQAAEADAAITVARAAADTARRNVGYATVHAPIAGTVIRLMRREGELVDGTPATPVAEIADPTDLEVHATAAPDDLVALRPGQEAAATFEALPGRTYEARVTRVAPAIDPQTGVGSVRLALSGDGERPPLGLFGTVTVDVGEQREAVVVPPSALRGGGGTETEVVVCAGGRADVRPVEVGVRGDAQVEITEGLRAGERVVTDHALGLEDGAELVTGGGA